MARRKLPEKYRVKDHDFALVMKGNRKSANTRKKMRRTFKRGGKQTELNYEYAVE